MKDKKDGGPAFPGENRHNLGMTLRDYFAAAALTGLIAKSIPAQWQEDRGMNPDNAPEKFSERAYEYADAMLAASEGR